MTKTTRRALFYGLIALFLVVGTGIVLYAQGWRLDVQTGRVSKIGAIYVRSYPSTAQISLNGKPVQNKSGFLSPGTLVSDLFPKQYVLRLTAAGYDAWQENVTVSPSLVATLKYAVLVPQNPIAIASGTVQQFLVEGTTIVQENANGAIMMASTTIGNGTITAGTSDASAYLFKTADGDYHLYDTQSGMTANVTAELARAGIGPQANLTVTFLDPGNGSPLLVIIGQEKIWLFDTMSLTLTPIEKASPTEIPSPSVAGENGTVAWTQFNKTTNLSAVALYDINAGSMRETSTTLPGAMEKIAWIRNGLLGILQNDGSLYLYDSDDTAQKLASDVTDFSTSADGTMVAALEHASVEVFTLGDSAGYYRFNIPNVADVQKLIWYRDDSHLFVVYSDHISFLDLADANLANFTTVAQGTSPQYDPSSNSLYFIDSANHLMRLSFPD